jgi:hypothetical protein
MSLGKLGIGHVCRCCAEAFRWTSSPYNMASQVTKETHCHNKFLVLTWQREPKVRRRRRKILLLGKYKLVCYKECVKKQLSHLVLSLNSIEIQFIIAHSHFLACDNISFIQYTTEIKCVLIYDSNYTAPMSISIWNQRNFSFLVPFELLYSLDTDLISEMRLQI